jgi:hypothetical protein
VIEQLLDRYAIEAQSYLDCQNILGTLGKTRAKLEAASQQLLNMRGTPSYSTLKRLMASTHSEQRKPTPPRAAASTSKATTTATTPNDGVLVRDAAHYRDREA